MNLCAGILERGERERQMRERRGREERGWRREERREEERAETPPPQAEYLYTYHVYGYLGGVGLRIRRLS